ncbi:MAG: CHAD domain-containing protein [Methylomicrobium sp.]
MTTLSLHFLFPGHLTAEKFLARLSENAFLKTAAEQYTLKTYYDTFDWRLYGKNLICEHNRSQKSSLLTIKKRHTGETLVSEETDNAPKFAHDFQSETIRQMLSPILDMRALLPLTTLECTLLQVNVLNNDEKTVLRLTIESYEHIPCRLRLTPVKGYDKAALKLVENLIRMGLVESYEPALLDALKVQGRRPKDYSSKLDIKLDPNMRSDLAVKYIFSHLLNVIKLNEQNAIADTDSEFLHDFRVAVRRTRSGLSQLKQVLPEEETKYFGRYFAWLGQITTPTRDLDAYLLEFDRYKNTVPADIRDDLNPLYDFLVRKQKTAQAHLADKLKTQEYLAPLIAWEEFLRTPTIKKPTQPNALLPIKTLADQRILKVYQRAIKQGRRISDLSPPHELHDLRKTCKKLRYLMEFFQSLYPEKKIKFLIKHLKDFQDILGEFQDLEVQEETLKKFSEEMRDEPIATDTFLAMGVLIQTVDQRRREVRATFAEKFADFDTPAIRQAFFELFDKQ